MLNHANHFVNTGRKYMLHNRKTDTPLFFIYVQATITEGLNIEIMKHLSIKTKISKWYSIFALGPTTCWVSMMYTKFTYNLIHMNYTQYDTRQVGRVITLICTHEVVGFELGWYWRGCLWFSSVSPSECQNNIWIRLQSFPSDGTVINPGRIIKWPGCLSVFCSTVLLPPAQCTCINIHLMVPFMLLFSRH